MAYAIRSEDLMAICIVLAEGDIDVDLSSVIARVESLQRDCGDHFGVWETDFRMSFFWLGYRNELYELNAIKPDGEVADFAQPLSAWLDRLLGWREVYFNDEGEHWVDWIPGEEADRQRRARAFLARITPLSPRDRLQELADIGWPAEGAAAFMEGGRWWNAWRVSDAGYP